MKTGFIRALWGVFDNSHRIIARRFRVENNIKKTISNKYSPECVTYVLGKDNFNRLNSLGVQNTVLIDDDPFKFNMVKYQFRNKLEILKYAIEHDAYDEIVYLDWDCYAKKQINSVFWEELRKKDVFQANLIIYHRIKCPWRTFDQRKTPNGGFIYLRDTKLITKAIEYWNTMPQDNDEPAWAKVVEELMGGQWSGSEEYLRRFEPNICNLHKSSPYTKDVLQNKNIYFVHYQGTGN